MINVLMLGGKRCGKTTTLSAMFSSLGVALAGTDLAITYDSEHTANELNIAKRVIIEKMKEFESPLTSCEVDENPSGGKREYSFRLTRGSAANKVQGIPFTIHDIPGEWLVNEPEKVKALIQVSQIIIIAIDTPYLFAKMTDKGYGKYHEEANRPAEITNFFKNTLSADDLLNRMILFVPIKCERYYHLDRDPHLKAFNRHYMSEVTQAVINGYKDLIYYLRSATGLVNRCTIAVTPILSAGGIDFISFRKNEEGKMVSYYQAPEGLLPHERGYSPKFCEQPMLYMLAYLLVLAITNQNGQGNQSGFFAYAKNITQGMNIQQMQAALHTIRTKMKRNNGIAVQEDGYIMIQNPMNL
ncbi:MAG: hypothetical protein IKK37_02695 [Clostridia bacterium]|nr:hypothetical protein [Clostridia bacterium]